MKRISFIVVFLIMLTGNGYSQKTTQSQLNWGNIWGYIFGGNLSWTTSNDWDNGVPADGDTVIVAHRMDCSSITNTLGQLDVTGTLNINPGSHIIVDDKLSADGIINVNGELTIYADASKQGRLISGSGDISGNFTYQQWVDRCGGWGLYGGPFGASLMDYADSSGGNMIFTGFAGSHYPGFHFLNTYFVDEDWLNGQGSNGYYEPPSGTTAMPRGQGFWYYNSDTVFSSPGNTIPQQWKVSTTGSMNLGSVFGFNVQYTNNGSAANDGWNLIANPYPGVIDWDTGNWTRTNVNNELQIFNTCGNNWASYVGGIGVNGGSNFISPFQGFYVKTNGASPALTCDNTVIANSTIPLLRSSTPRNILRIFSEQDEIAIRLDSAASGSFGPLDASKLIYGGSVLYTMTAPDTTNYAINALPHSDTVIVPVYMRNSDSIYVFPDDVQDYEVYLEDLLSDTTVEMATGQPYEFDTAFQNFTHVANVHLYRSTEIDAIVEPVGKEINIRKFTYSDRFEFALDQQDEIFQVEVFDVQGRLLQSGTLKGQERFTVDRRNQLLLVRFIGDGGIVVEKIM